MLHIAKIVGPVSFGLWNLAQAWMLYLFRFGELGLEVVGIRAVVRDKLHLASIVWSVVVLRLLILLLLIVCIVTLALLDLFPPGSTKLIVILSLALLPLALLLEWVFESYQIVGSISVVRVLRGFLFLVLIYFFVSRDDQMVDAAYYYVISVAIANLAISWIAIKRFNLLPLRPQRDIASQLFREGLPVGIATVLANYSFFAGTMMIGYMIGGNDLGYYTAAHRLIVFFWAYGIATAHRVLLPQFSRLFHESPQSLNEFISKVTKATSLLSLPVCIIAIAGGDQTIELLYGTRYGSSAPILKIFAGVFFISIVRSIFEIGLLAANKQKQFLKGMVGVAVMATLLTYVGVRLRGIEGAAWASLVVEAGYAFYLFRVSHFVGARQILSVVGKPILLAIVTVLVLLLSGLTSLFVIIPVGTALYFLLLIIAGQLSSKEIQLGLNLVGLKSASR